MLTDSGMIPDNTFSNSLILKSYAEKTKEITTELLL